MIWKFRDGTEVETGGIVRGASLFAQRLRQDIDNPPVLVQVDPIPSEPVTVAMNDDRAIDAWLGQEALRAGVEFSERPQIAQLEPRTIDDADDPEGALF
jgi:hypothetical protein